VSAVDRIFFKICNFVLVVAMVAMVLMVFVNVVLRAAFNSGIDMSEELPRFLFVWMTFIGAIVAMREGSHLGVDTLVRILPLLGKKICWALCQMLIIICCVFMIVGTFELHDFNAFNLAPVTQLPMIWVFGVTYITGVAILILSVTNLVRLALGKVPEDELIQVEEEGMHEAQAHTLQVKA
jgi:TRAP-type transport system small permease protein